MKKIGTSLALTFMLILLCITPQTAKAKESGVEEEKKEPEIVEEVSEEEATPDPEVKPNPEVKPDTEAVLGNVEFQVYSISIYGEKAYLTTVTTQGEVGTKVTLPKEIEGYSYEEYKLSTPTLFDNVNYTADTQIYELYIYRDLHSTMVHFFDQSAQDACLTGMPADINEPYPELSVCGQGYPLLLNSIINNTKEGTISTYKIPEIEGYTLSNVKIIRIHHSFLPATDPVTPNKYEVLTLKPEEIKNGEIQVETAKADNIVKVEYLEDKPTTTPETVKPVTQKDKNVNTGEKNSMIFFIGLGAIALIVGGVVVVRRKKNE